ncbi:MAG: hypothetical protein RLZZ618_799 [Pseudomonadota bacterium]|jgi:hypothetical protein
MLQTNQAIGAVTLDTPPLLDGNLAVGAAPEHVNPLLWKLASTAEREVLRSGNTPTQTATTTAAPSALPRAQAPAAAPRAAAAAPAAATSQASSADQAALVKVTDQFRARFADAAKDPTKFEALLTKAFGDKYDKAAAEGLRQQALRNDFSWMPKIEVVSSAQMADQSGTQGEGVALGAYAKASDTIYLSRELLHTDPAKAERILTEEVGHALDARINTTDALGDEGDIFSALLHGDNVTDAQLQEMRADNDHGTVTINGKTVDVEYGLFKKIKKAFKSVANAVVNTVKAGVKVAVGFATFNPSMVKEGFTEGFNAVKTAVSEAWKDLKDEFKKVMNSKWLGIVLTICRYIPIPIVALVANIVSAVKAAYTVYQGIKYKSIGAVLSGVAGLAGGAANFAGSLGATASTVSSIQSFADGAQKVSMAYNAASAKSFGQAASLVAQVVGAPASVVQAANTVATVEKVVKAVETKDYAGAVAGVATFAASNTGKDLGISKETADNIKDIATTVKTVQNVVAAVEKKDYVGVAAGVATFAASNTGKDLGISKETADNIKDIATTVKTVQNVVTAVEKKNYAGAVAGVAAFAASENGKDLGISQDTAKSLADVAKTAKNVQNVVNAVEKKDYVSIIAAGALGASGATKETLGEIGQVRKAVQNQDYRQAVEATNTVLGKPVSAATVAALQDVAEIAGDIRTVRTKFDERNYRATGAAVTETVKDIKAAQASGAIATAVSNQTQALQDLWANWGTAQAKH